MQTAGVNYYSVLGVTPKSTASDIKQKYRELSKKYHPDTQGGDTARMSLINEAYAVLSNPLKKREYQPPAQKSPPYSPVYQKAQPQTRRQAAKRQTELKDEESENQWFVFLSYVLAIPIAILIINIGLPAFKQILPTGKTVIIEQAPVQTVQTAPPAQTTPPSVNAQNTTAEDILQSNLFYDSIGDDSTN